MPPLSDIENNKPVVGVKDAWRSRFDASCLALLKIQAELQEAAQQQDELTKEAFLRVAREKSAPSVLSW